MQKYIIYTLRFFLFMLSCGSPISVSYASERSENGEPSLEDMYDYHCHTWSDIYEHLPVLRQLAQECSSVTEIGVRSIVSTWGILQGLSENFSGQRDYLGIDLQYPPADQLDLARKLAEENGINFKFWQMNDMHIELEPMDMLFIDSLHTYCHLTYELETFSPKVRKYICMHDTSKPWGKKDDTAYSGDYSEYPDSYDRTKQGLWPAVEDFLESHPEWSLLERRTNSHGFTILERNDETAVTDVSYDPNVDYYLKNKIILCTGPSLERYEMLKNTTENDLNFIPFKKIFVTTNEPTIMDITFNGEKPICQLIENREKQIDCLNCIITTMKNAVNDPDVQDDDIIIFKHESVFINDMNLIKKAIDTLLNGSNMIVRTRWGDSGTDAFYVKVSAIKELIKNYPFVIEFPPDAPHCEAYFTKYIVNQISDVYDIPYAHSNWTFTELGFYHIPGAPRDTIEWWDKENYSELFDKHN